MSISLEIAHAKALSAMDKLNAVEAVIAAYRMMHETQTMEIVLKHRLRASIEHLNKTGVAFAEAAERTGISVGALEKYANLDLGSLP